MAVECAKKFDFLEVVVYDVHCRAMARLIARQKFESAFKEGVGLYGALCYFGISGQPSVHPDFGTEVGYRNIYMVPDPSTLTPSHEGKGRVGHVVCDVIDDDGQKVSISPRTVAQRQLTRLKETLGLTLKSAAEIEFDLQDPVTDTDFAHTEMWSNLKVLDVNTDLIIEFLDALRAVNVNVDTLQPEYGPGQFEITCDVAEGIRGPDTTARFKSVAKGFFKKRGITATFMTRSRLDRTSSGMHFNHSLWTQDGKNAMYDPKAPNKTSDICKAWLAGLVKHAPAITALCCPTINCYRRIGAPWAPDVSNWGNTRGASFRLKVEGTNVYVENRIPSAASNPYLVVAATVAAGIDGVLNKLPLPSVTESFPQLPRDLDTALRVLESDDVIVQALGPDVIKHFVYCKRTFELEPFSEVKDATLEEQFQKEKEMYFENA